MKEKEKNIYGIHQYTLTRRRKIRVYLFLAFCNDTETGTRGYGRPAFMRRDKLRSIYH
jgi:hypothetical protein